MGDTLFQTFSDMTNWIFKHVLPQKNLRDSAQATLEKAKDQLHNFGKTSREEHMTADEHCRHVVRTFSERLEAHIDEDELKELSEANQEGMCARIFAVTTILCGVLRSWRLQTRKSAANYIIRTGRSASARHSLLPLRPGQRTQTSTRRHDVWHITQAVFLA